MKRKNIILVFFFFPILVMATGWDNLVDYYFKKHIDRELYAVSDIGSPTHFAFWKTNEIGFACPSIKSLTNVDYVVVDKWISTMNATNAANVICASNSPLKIWQIVYNKHNPTNQITDAELFSTATNRIKQASAVSLE